jgi:hypothetical protein
MFQCPATQPRYSSGLICYSEPRQLSTEDRRKFYLNFLCESGINFAGKVRLDNKNILMCVFTNVT